MFGVSHICGLYQCFIIYCGLYTKCVDTFTHIHLCRCYIFNVSQACFIDVHYSIYLKYNIVFIYTWADCVFILYTQEVVKYVYWVWFNILSSMISDRVNILFRQYLLMCVVTILSNTIIIYICALVTLCVIYLIFYIFVQHIDIVQTHP